MSEAVLDLQKVTLTFRGRSVLDNVSLRLKRGDFVGLIGPNGAGKTVLLKVILGLIPVDTGSVRIFGGTPEQARGRVGYVPQYGRFDVDFPISVRDVVLMGRLGVNNRRGSYSAVDQEAAMQALERVAMSEKASRQIGQLSGGELQRVLIARALALEPELFLLDEPTASLDSPIGRSVYELLEELSQEMTIVLVSHDIGVIARHVKTVACLNRTMHYHDSKELSGDVLQEVYGCPVELLAHGHAHRVLPEHGGEE